VFGIEQVARLSPVVDNPHSTIMRDRPKRGSSRRKGDEFQDLTALRLVLELYIAGEDFRVFLEYEKAEAIDDIVIFTGKSIRAIQAKYAVDPLAVYVSDSFTQKDSRTYFGRSRFTRDEPHSRGNRRSDHSRPVPVVAARAQHDPQNARKPGSGGSQRSGCVFDNPVPSSLTN
jgi:hypothetical protein